MNPVLVEMRASSAPARLHTFAQHLEDLLVFLAAQIPVWISPAHQLPQGLFGDSLIFRFPTCTAMPVLRCGNHTDVILSRRRRIITNKILGLRGTVRF